MGSVSKQHNFVWDEDANPDHVNENFNDIYAFVNTQTIHKDASIAFTAVPSGPSIDPTVDDQFARKKYVDDKATASNNSATALTRVREKYLAGTFTNNTAVNRNFDHNAWADLVSVTYTPTSTSERLRVNCFAADLYIANLTDPTFFTDYRVVKVVSSTTTQLSCGFGTAAVTTPIAGNSIHATGFDFSPAAVSTTYALQVKNRTAVLGAAHNPSWITVESLGFSS